PGSDAPTPNIISPPRRRPPGSDRGPGSAPPSAACPGKQAKGPRSRSPCAQAEPVARIPNPGSGGLLLGRIADEIGVVVHQGAGDAPDREGVAVDRADRRHL